MTKIAVLAGLLIFSACTINMYDYSTHSGGGGVQPPDTVYVESSSPAFPVPPSAFQDTVYSRYLLLGGGHVEIERCGNWSRSTLVGCKTETDGVAFEVRPVIISVGSSRRSAAKEFQLEFTCRMQSYMIDSDVESLVMHSGVSSSTDGGTLLPVVTGTEVVTIVANRTSFPFLAEQAESYEGNWLPDGTLLYEAAFSLPQWMLREICTAEQLVVSSESPDFRMLFGDTERRLLQQFFDIFVIHGGEAPVLPVGADSGVIGN
ncbi:MAG: hypothetical protein KAR40_02430 [Candidatus Sabulitectum sp.]|nr:hypothetical protein [Candidatus Sabulitectum sp.]